MSHRGPSAQAPAAKLLLRAAVALSAAGAALSVGSGAAQAASALPGAGGVLGGTLHGAADGLGPVKHLKLDPLAGTGTDPLTNGLGTQVADFKPIGTQTLTGPLTDGASLSQLPVLGTASDVLPG
jgi:hypothetical protein